MFPLRYRIDDGTPTPGGVPAILRVADTESLSVRLRVKKSIASDTATDHEVFGMRYVGSIARFYVATPSQPLSSLCE
jgi:hypothetical protein